MIGCLYLILALIFGWEITGSILPEQKMKEKGITSLWVRFPAAFGCGVLLQTWAVYIAAWMISVYGGSEKPLFGADLLVMGTIFAILAIIFFLRKKKGGAIFRNVPEELPPCREILFFLFLLLFITWIMFYVFHMKDGQLYSGYSVFSD